MFTYFKNHKYGKSQSNHCPQLTCTQKHSTLVISGGITHWTTDVKLRTHTSAVEVFQTNQCTALSLCQLNTVACHVPLLIICVGETKANGVPSRQAHCTSISNLITRALPANHIKTSSTLQASPSPPTWQVLPECPLSYSTAAELGGGLLAIGGMDDSDSPSSAVHMYSPQDKWCSTNSLVRISSGGLPVPRFFAVGCCNQAERGRSHLQCMWGEELNLTAHPPKLFTLELCNM